jgi:hypothetical protein
MQIVAIKALCMAGGQCQVLLSSVGEVAPREGRGVLLLDVGLLTSN